LAGVLHDSLYRPWSSKVLKVFSDEFEDKGDDEKETKESDAVELELKGPLNKIGSLIIKKMIKEGKTS
jgi:hypothetical protein